MIDPATERKKLADRMGIAVIVIVAIIVAGVLWESHSRTAQALDATTFCPKDGPPAGLLVVLIDTTDPISAVPQAQVKNQLQDDIDKLPEYAEVQLYTVGPVGGSLLRPVATVCNPGSGQGEDFFWHNPRMEKSRWQRRFIDPLDHKLDRLMTAPSADTSPILESIQSIAASVFGRPEFDSVPKRLVIVSDMAQNTAGFSQYRGPESFEQFRHGSYYLTVRPHLDRVDVSILYLLREDVRRIQDHQHIEFWQDYFSDAGATLSGVTSIEG
jgi:hypothetical protein